MQRRDEMVNNLLPTLVEGATGLGTLAKEERIALFRQMAEIVYELVDEVIAVGKETEVIPPTRY